MNKCYNDLLNDNQSSKRSIIYNYKSFEACVDIGNIRKRQEDSVLFLERPEDNNIKIIALSDGMGGLANGGKASRIAMLKLSRWFLSTKSKVIDDIKIELSLLFDDIDETIRKECYGGGTTLSAALIINDDVLLINIGDSRIYVLNSFMFTQKSRDHSISWELYKNGVIKDKDAIRFHKKNNLITSRLGCDNKKLVVEYNVLHSGEYSNIMIFSDGITDCLSDDQLLNIALNRYNSLAESFVYAAINNISTRADLDSKDYYNTINGGKDNSSVVIYKRRLVK